MTNYLRNTLQNKSLIQLELEKVQRAEKLQNYIVEFLDSYEIDDIVFGINENKPCEIKNGYMAITDRFETLVEATKTIDSPNSVIRCTPEGYFTGKCYNTISECGREVIFDINNLEYIY